jgi:hypothetical protein
MLRQGEESSFCEQKEALPFAFPFLAIVIPIKDGLEKGCGSASFLKKRSKKLLISLDRIRPSA